ncbi:hypothetical protein DM02DRAFT_109179 [Periconia macrospinosa]|uniref:Uncharacterized protein n=1 Tax=Periconia macrospinosa TaxID=97972 RepID=A0A2V1E3R5_9PLEO|nr:hypothetical protein DM02DRAFT_109179 [Periconia macrospinosa]
MCGLASSPLITLQSLGPLGLAPTPTLLLCSVPCHCQLPQATTGHSEHCYRQLPAEPARGSRPGTPAQHRAAKGKGSVGKGPPASPFSSRVHCAHGPILPSSPICHHQLERLKLVVPRACVRACIHSFIHSNAFLAVQCKRSWAGGDSPPPLANVHCPLHFPPSTVHHPPSTTIHRRLCSHLSYPKQS